MHTESIDRWRHDHTFGQDIRRAGEGRTIVVIVITAITMVVEIAAGLAFGSMALLADGLHMGSHASALAITAFAYYYTRRHATDPRFNFGTGKVSSLAAFASAVLLAVFALMMAVESVDRLLAPVAIEFDQAILVAILGLVVNGICLLILGGHSHDSAAHAHGAHAHGGHADHGHDGHKQAAPGKDLNLLSAYLHVAADALTSLLAIGALVVGKYFGQVWLDPFMGLVGAALIVRWSWGLLRLSAHVLLDMRAPSPLLEAIRRAVEQEADNRVADLHVWGIGPGIFAAEVVVVTSRPEPPECYLELLPPQLGVVHMTTEVRLCSDH